MKRSLSVGATLAMLLAVAISAAGVAPALASTIDHEYLSTQAMVFINIPNHTPEMELVCQHFEPNSDHGPGNNLFLFLPTAKGYAPVAVLTTAPSRVSYIPTIWAGYPVANNVILVDNWDLQICRIGKTAVVYWTEPIKGTITGNVPGTNVPWSTAFGISSFELSPGSLILNGYGSSTTSTTILPVASGYTFEFDYTMLYNTHGTFLCPSWHYFGPIADTPTSTLSANTNLIITHP